jgi:cytochrome c peroxidase
MRSADEASIAHCKLVSLAPNLVSQEATPLTVTGCSRIAIAKLAATAFVLALAFTALAQTQPAPTQASLRVRLGFKLFKDDRFSSPQGDLQNSCSSCHLSDEDPQGMRAHTDFFARSWVPFRSGDPRRDELRNSPTILDSALMPRLHFDGEFSSLEDLVRGTLAGRPMGWLPGEQEQCFERIQGIILKDSASDAASDNGYAALFKTAYGAEVDRLSKSELIEIAVRAISEYVRTLRTTRATPYDRFVAMNGLDSSPRPSEEAKAFAARLLNDIAALEKKRALKLPAGFDNVALTGLKKFFRTNATTSAGNCVTCHTPPMFTDLSFHNMGISQTEYDQVNGDGAFAKLQIPGAAQAQRPSAQFRETPSKRKPGCADLGYWNFVDLKDSPLRRVGESDDHFLQRMIATFKTPTLRDLAYTYPYMHTGAFTTLESALTELARLSERAREGKLREADEELSKIRIAEADIASIAAFLNTLNDDLKPGRKY